MFLRVAYVTIFLTILLTGLQTAWYYKKLPDPVASHFDNNGKPDQFISKLSFMILNNAIQLTMAVTLVSLAKLLPKLPDSMINTPQKEYWLTEENRPHFFRINELILVSIAASTGVFLLLIFQLAIESNLKKQPLNQAAFIVAVVVYLTFVLGTCLKLYLHLSANKKIESDSLN